MPAEGMLTLHIGDKEVGQGRIKTQPGKFFIVGEGLNIGKDGGEPVSDEPFVDLAAEARMALLRD